jgi:peptide/nickel transport system permease protein
VGLPFEEPSGLTNWGTDSLGRDIFSKMVYGSRLSLLIGFAATFWGVTLGYIWGLLQGYWGGSWFDTISQRIGEAKLSIPSLILALTFVAVFGPSIRNVIIAIGLNYVASGARTVRSLSLSIRENAYIDAARAIGAPTWRIIFVHVLPNTISIYLILLSLHIGGAILSEASLSFLGAGVPVDTPSWGGMVNQGTKQALLGGVPWLAIFPGTAIALTVYGFNLLGDALRDSLDPRLRGSR